LGKQRAKQAKDPEQYHGRIRFGSKGTTDPSAPTEGNPPPARSVAGEAANWTISARLPHQPPKLLLAVASRLDFYQSYFFYASLPRGCFATGPPHVLAAAGDDGAAGRDDGVGERGGDGGQKW